jgi:hypothetical protein
MGLQRVHVRVGRAENGREERRDTQGIKLRLGRVVGQHAETKAAPLQLQQQSVKSGPSAPGQVFQGSPKHPVFDDLSDLLLGSASSRGGLSNLKVREPAGNGRSTAHLLMDRSVRTQDTGDSRRAPGRSQHDRSGRDLGHHQRTQTTLVVERAVDIEKHGANASSTPQDNRLVGDGSN